MLLGDNNGVTKSVGRRRATMVEHKTLRKYLGRYSGLILYLKEMDEAVYGKICAVRAPRFFPLSPLALTWSWGQSYFSAASELHNAQMQALFTAYAISVKKPAEDDSGGDGVCGFH
jgi:hypothetical protein